MYKGQHGFYIDCHCFFSDKGHEAENLQKECFLLYYHFPMGNSSESHVFTVGDQQVVDEGPSKSSVVNGSPCAWRGFALLILCIHICHSMIHPHAKFQRNQGNINIVIDIQSSNSHIHWPLFEDEKEERVETGGINFHKKSCCVETFVPKKDVGKTHEYST